VKQNLLGFFGRFVGKPPVADRVQAPPRLGASAWVLGSALALILMAYGNRGLWNLLRLRSERQDLQSDILRLQTQIDGLQAEYKDYGTHPEAVERTAREELNLIRPGETVYKFGSSAR